MAECSTSHQEVQELLAEINGDKMSGLTGLASDTGVDTSSSQHTKKRSLVWMHFKKLSEHQASCDICNEQVATSGSTTNMVKV